MHPWVTRLHVIATVGGGFTGLAVTLAKLMGGWPQLKVAAVLVFSAFGAFFVWSIYVGLRLSEGGNVIRELRIFYVAQILHFTTPALSFHVGLGLMLYVGALPSGQNVLATVGAYWNTGIFQGEGWFLAVNIVPLIMLWLMRRSNNSLERSREG
jgi:hypothetical protein